MINIVIPMAGHSRFFNQEDTVFPESLIEVAGKIMIARVVENLQTIHSKLHFSFIVNQEDCIKFHLDDILRLLTQNDCTLIKVDRPTKGAACSALLAIDQIDSELPLIISNSNQIFSTDLNSILQTFKTHHYDSAVISFETLHPRWSYVRLDEEGHIVETAEKRPISKHAIAGFYYFKEGREFTKAAMQSIEKKASVNGLYYIAPTLNEMVIQNKKLGVAHIQVSDYHTFYSPQKIKEYEQGYAL